MAAAVLRFFSGFTRRLEVTLGGIDPAVLGILTGTVGGIAAAAGLRRFRWTPDFTAESFRFRLHWRLSISLFGFLIWVGRGGQEIVSAFRRRKDAGLLNSVP